MKLYNTIIAGSGLQCTADTLSGDKGNHVSDGCSQSPGGDLKLGSLTGSPGYLPLQTGSVAIDMGDDGKCADIDIINTDRDENSPCDIGAFEYVPPDAMGQALATATATATLAPPAAPTNLTAVKVSGGVKLTWTASADAQGGYNILRYRPDRGETVPQQLVLLTSPSASSFTDSSANTEEVFVYQVQSVRGSQVSELSNEARIDLSPTATPTSTPTATETAAPPTNTTVPLGKPTNLTASVNPSGVALSWTAPAGQVDGYEILRRRPKRGEDELQTLVSDTGSSATSYTDTTATEHGERYFYRVKAIRNGARSDRSNFVRVDRPTATNTPLPPPTNTPVPPPTNTPVPPPTNTSVPLPTNTSVPPTNTPVPPPDTAVPLGKPTNLTASVDSSGVTLSWTAPAGQVDGYEILRRRPKRDDEPDLLVLVSDTGSSATTYTDATAIESGERYFYRVKAIRNGVRSDRSNFAKADRP